jgi:hypothetical protein
MSETKIRRITKKKLDGVVIKKDKHSINPLVLMKKLPTDINILINSFLYDKNGNNEDLIKYFNKIVLNDEMFIKKINSIYFNEVIQTIHYEDGMNEYEFHIRKKLVNGLGFKFASNIEIEFEDTDDGRPTGSIFIRGEKNSMIGELVEEDDLIEKYNENELITKTDILEDIKPEILFKYFQEHISYNEDCIPNEKQIRALQLREDNCSIKILRSYIMMGSGESCFYEWFVSYYTKEAFECFYETMSEGYYGADYTIIKINLGWKTTWLVLS